MCTIRTPAANASSEGWPEQIGREPRRNNASSESPAGVPSRYCPSMQKGQPVAALPVYRCFSSLLVVVAVVVAIAAARHLQVIIHPQAIGVLLRDPHGFVAVTARWHRSGQVDAVVAHIHVHV